MSPSRSKKRCAASSSSRPPEPHTYFLDRSLGKVKLAASLRKAGLGVEVHDDHFPQDAPDEDWLGKVGQKGWVVLTKDDKIRYHPRELQTLIAHGVRAFVLTARGLSADEMARIFLGLMAKIERFLGRHGGPFLVAITRGGAMTVLWPEPRRRRRVR